MTQDLILKTELALEKYNALSPERLKELVAKAKDGDLEAIELVINSVSRLIYKDAEKEFKRQNPSHSKLDIKIGC